jgi:glycerate kinase
VNILIAPDKFKGSLSAVEVCDAVSDALMEMNTSFLITKVPLADGGEGTFEILVDQSEGRIKKVSVLDPLQRPIKAEYGLSKTGTTAFIEMAKASGLQLLKENERNPLYSTTMGTGQLILDALDEGASNIILGIGGSATNDAGMGMAHALGYRFLDRENQPLAPIGKSLSLIDSIDETQVDVRLRNIEFKVLCDVTNPLHGPHGAAAIYGPQKGASEIMVKELDTGLKHLADLVKKKYGTELNFPGAGAAGGLGAGAKLFLNATLQKGIDYISQATGLEEKVRTSDLVITGEGKVDQQSLSGKVVAHVYALAKEYNKRVLILCGQCTLSPDDRLAFGTDKILTLANDPSEVSLAMEQPTILIKSTIKHALSDLS